MRLPNGDRLQAKPLRSLPVAGLKLPAAPLAEYTSYGQQRLVYRVEDLPEACAAGWILRRLPAGATQWVEERATVHLPGEVRTVSEGVMPLPWLFPQFVVAPDGSLLAVNYTLRRVADGRFQEKCPVTILRSTDAGRTWDLWSEIPYDPDPKADAKAAAREGFTEPYLLFMPDGSALCLLRTTDGEGVGPMYWTRSTDNGRTWTKPAVFDDLGAWPQMLTLKNGVTLAVYGRPGLYVRATADPAGRRWDDRATVVEPGAVHTDTCSYAALLPLGDDTALIAYSEFNLAGPAGKPCKGIRVRTVKATRNPLSLGSRRELFIDKFLIERLDNARLKLHEPISGGVVLRNDKPWEGPANFGMSVIEVDGRLLMYYRGWSLTDAADQNGVGCVAESRDGGATWTKPALNLVAKPEWPDNNIIATDDGEPRFAFPCAPWVDTRPGVPAAERIKMIQSEPVSGEKHTAMMDPAGPKRLVFWASADGFTFRKLDPQPEMISGLRNCFDGGNTMFWSEIEQQYVLYYRWYDDEWGRGHRTMARTTSKDLMTWTPSVPMTYGDTPREQFYTNNTQPYFRAPHLYVAPAARFMEGRQAITAAQAAAIGVKSTGPHVYFKDCSDAVLLTSRAGSTVYDRTFLETFIRPGLGAGNWVSRTNYPLTGILPAGPDRMQMFVSRHYMQDSWHIERLLLRTDGFASVSAPWAGGEMVTKPITFTGKALELNYRTGAPGFVRVEIQDAAGTPIPGYTLDDCPEIIGDEIARVVAWKAGPDVSRLAGQPVRLRFVMKDADLYSIRFGIVREISERNGASRRFLIDQTGSNTGG